MAKTKKAVTNAVHAVSLDMKQVFEKMFAKAMQQYDKTLSTLEKKLEALRVHQKAPQKASAKKAQKNIKAKPSAKAPAKAKPKKSKKTAKQA